MRRPYLRSCGAISFNYLPLLIDFSWLLVDLQPTLSGVLCAPLCSLHLFIDVSSTDSVYRPFNWLPYWQHFRSGHGSHVFPLFSLFLKNTCRQYFPLQIAEVMNGVVDCTSEFLHQYLVVKFQVAMPQSDIFPLFSHLKKNTCHQYFTLQIGEVINQLLDYTSEFFHQNLFVKFSVTMPQSDVQIWDHFIFSIFSNF